MSRSRRSVLGLAASAGALAVAPAGTARVATAPSESDTGRRRRREPSAPSISFDDQRLDGATLVVASVVLEAGGFVVLSKDDVLYGVSEYLEPGRYEQLPVTLDRPLLETGDLTATIQTDTNGNRTFDATTVKLDCSQRDEESAVVSDTATVTVPRFENSELVFEDQEVTDTVVVESATLPEGGWIQLYSFWESGEDGEAREVGGTEFLEPGRHEGVEIQVGSRTPPDCREELEALLLRDVDGDGDLQFDYHHPGPDYPYFPGSARATVTYADCDPTATDT